MSSIKIKQIVLVFSTSVIILMIMIIINKVFNIDYAWMTRDVSVLANMNPFVGFLSSLGILLWGVTSSICFFSSTLIKTQKFNFWFLLSSGLLTLYLLLDDLFLIHEQSSNFVFGGEKLIFLILGVVVLFHLIIFKSVYFKSNYALFLISLFFFAFSIIMDSIPSEVRSSLYCDPYLLEDGAKWFGIAYWCGYYVNISFSLVSAKVSASQQI